MRAFNQREENIIRLIAACGVDNMNTFQKVLQDKYFTISRKEILVLSHSERRVILFIKSEDFIDEKKRAKHIGEFWELISLINYLIDSRMINQMKIPTRQGIDLMYEDIEINRYSDIPNTFFTKSDNQLTITGEGIKNTHGDVLFMPLSFDGLYDSICDCLLAIFYPTESLKSLADHNFESEEDIKFKHQKRISWTAIGIALLTSCVSIGYSIKLSNDSSNKIDEQNQIIESVVNRLIEQNSIHVEKLSNSINKIKRNLVSDTLTNSMFRYILKELKESNSDLKEVKNEIKAHNRVDG